MVLWIPLIIMAVLVLAAVIMWGIFLTSPQASAYIAAAVIKYTEEQKCKRGR